MGNLSNLCELWAVAVGLTVFPAEVCYLSLLQTFSLAQNAIASVPDEVGKLSKLKRLSLAQNRLPSSFGELQSLAVLVLDGNEMREFPLVLTGMKALRNLSLRKNSISSIPAALGDCLLAKQAKVDLRGNGLNTLKMSQSWLL